MQQDKEQLFQLAIAKVKETIQLLKEERKAISEGILEDTKSSAGDKFETSREMLTQDLKQVETQLEKNQTDLDELYRIQAIKSSAGMIQEGSLVNLGTDWFLISVSLGQLEMDGKKYFLLSKNSPLGQLLLGKQVDEAVPFRGKPQVIHSIL